MVHNAITMGYAIPENDFEARIHSVFDSAVNIRIGTNRDLLTIVTSTGTDLPQGIRIDSPEGFTFYGFQKNEEIFCQAGILTITKPPMQIDLRKATRWHCDFSGFSLDPEGTASTRSWNLVWKLLNDHQKVKGTEFLASELIDPSFNYSSRLNQRLSVAISGLLKATNQFTIRNNDFISDLIGLGSGLTPTGDDLLVGFLAGLRYKLGVSSVRRDYLNDLGIRILSLSSQTTDISFTYLFHATKGQFSRSIFDLANAICNNADSSKLYETTSLAIQVGHSSGSDTVTGLMLGLTAWDEESII